MFEFIYYYYRDLNEFEGAFQFACPKFLFATLPNWENQIPPNNYKVGVACTFGEFQLLKIMYWNFHWIGTPQPTAERVYDGGHEPSIDLYHEEVFEITQLNNLVRLLLILNHVLNSYLKLYTTMPISKLASFMDMVSCLHFWRVAKCLLFMTFF